MPPLEFRSTVDRDTGPCNPARRVRSQERNHLGNVLRLSDSLQRLHRKGHLSTCLRLCEIRDVRLDHSWRNSIYTNSARSENRREVLDESLDGSLGRGVSKDRRIIKIGF